MLLETAVNTEVTLSSVRVSSWIHTRCSFGNFCAHIVCGLAANSTSLQSYVIGGNVNFHFKVITMMAGILFTIVGILGLISMRISNNSLLLSVILLSLLSLIFASSGFYVWFFIPFFNIKKNRRTITSVMLTFIYFLEILICIITLLMSIKAIFISKRKIPMVQLMLPIENRELHMKYTEFKKPLPSNDYYYQLPSKL